MPLGAQSGVCVPHESLSLGSADDRGWATGYCRRK
eukprot:jgi/Antlo1/2460/1714